MGVNVNFNSNHYNYNSFSGTKSEGEIRLAAQEKTREEMNPDRYNRNSKFLYGLTFAPFLLADIIANPGAKGLLKFGSFATTVAGFGALLHVVSNNSPTIKDFQKNNPMLSMILNCFGFMAIYNLINKGLEAGRLYDRTASSLDTKWDNFKNKDFYKKVENTKIHRSITNAWNKFKLKISTPTGNKLLFWSPLAIIAASIIRDEHYKNKYRHTFEKNYAQMKAMDI